MCFLPAAKEILDKCALALNSKLAQNPALSCAIVVSQPICQYIDIGSSYSRCLDSICPPSYGESCSYISVEDVPVHNMCAVSLDDEARMINFLLSGSHINAGNMLRSIFTEHFGTEKSITADVLYERKCRKNDGNRGRCAEAEKENLGG